MTAAELQDKIYEVIDDTIEAGYEGSIVGRWDASVLVFKLAIDFAKHHAGLAFDEAIKSAAQTTGTTYTALANSCKLDKDEYLNNTFK